MRLLFIVDPLSLLKPAKDSSVVLMRAAAARGDAVYSATIDDLAVDGGKVWAHATALELSADDRQWVREQQTERLAADDFDLVLMRKEPPVDGRFFTTTLLLDLINAPVHNAPRALREWNEKLAIFRFPDLIPPSWTGTVVSEAAKFKAAHGDVVLKPLDGMGGDGVYISPAADKNFYSVFNLLGKNGARPVMAQAYLPAATGGDARVFVVGGRPLKWMLARIPRADDHRSNLAVGGTPEARPLSEPARRIAEAVGPELAAAGITFAGLDVVGDRLIEINITCPTGLREVIDQTGDDIAAEVLAALSPSAAG